MNREIKFRAYYDRKIRNVNFIDFKNNTVDLDIDGIATTLSIKNIDLMSRIGQKSIRTYDQFIWLKSGYEDWYDALFDISKLPINRWKKYVNS